MDSTIIIPTYNEAENLPELAKRIRAVCNAEILVVDDNSPDGTAKIAEELGCKVLNRKGRQKGLSASVIEALHTVGTDKIIVMDADLQHPPEALPRIIDELDKADFVVASRYIKGGSCKEWDLDRKVLSRVANLLAYPIAGVKDAVSGFFGLRRVGLPDLSIASTRGFKIMLELLVKGKWNRVAEIPYTFDVRTKGSSKLSVDKITDYALQLAGLYLFRLKRFLKFSTSAIIGSIVVFALTPVLVELFRIHYMLALLGTSLISILIKYYLNDRWTWQAHNKARQQENKGIISFGIEILKRMAKPRISRANFALTYMCNQKCLTCRIWKRYREHPELLQEELSTEEVAKVIENNNLMWLSFTGGEPFMREDIGEILKLSMNKLPMTSIVTNGSMPERIERAVRYALADKGGLLTLNVSVEGTEQTHSLMSGRDWYSRAIETMERLSRIGSKRLKLGVEQVLSEYNTSPADMQAVCNLVKRLSLGLTYTIDQTASFYDNTSRQVKAVELPKVKLGLKPQDIMNRLFLSRNGKSNLKGKCVAGKFSCFIDPYGNVCPCIFMSDKPVASLRETGYRIPQLERVRNCQTGCWTPCETYATMLFRPWRVLV